MIYVIIIIIIWLIIGLCVADKRYSFIEEIQDDFNIYSAPKVFGKAILSVVAWPLSLVSAEREDLSGMSSQEYIEYLRKETGEFEATLKMVAGAFIVFGALCFIFI